MSTARNLLVGILAVQMNFIRVDELIQAMNHWVLEKHLSLSAILTKHHILSTTRAALLDAVLDEHLKAHGEDARRCLLTLSYNGSLSASLQQINDEEVQQSVQGLGNATKHQTGERVLTRGLLRYHKIYSMHRFACFLTSSSVASLISFSILGISAFVPNEFRLLATYRCVSRSAVLN